MYFPAGSGQGPCASGPARLDASSVATGLRRITACNALGLDTSVPGNYVITGLYEERGEVQKDRQSGQDVTLWGGSLASNTITVEVVAH